ncbi:NADPH-dependent assimilatory sulfite reductase hemoprotein subunit [Tepidicaulis sp. LMO-SS28]|uniref:NADPH-dependent assimilatory sulfite reductase hemoprotein subunit n=1 Tax=Tepidicaulis sp. LMO-SS28 TaxID=3447455 RepID=UPI003EE0FA57
MVIIVTNVTRENDISQPVEDLHPNEGLKKRSNFLRGTISQGLEDAITGALSVDDTQLIKFHGIYQQDDRDLRTERRRQKLEPAYQFMVRVRLPGGVLSPEQWLKLDAIARDYANGTLRLTTRQTFQFHGVLKQNIRNTIAALDSVLLDTIAACGDDSRGVMCAVNPYLSALHGEIHDLARRTSDHMIPRTGAYREIWLNEKKVAGGSEEPMYGETYLPRKFKIGFALPPANDIDVYTQDLGFIAITEQEKLVGFNICVGGGMGRTDRAPHTYPRLGDVIGYVSKDKVIAVAEHTASIQRDFGNRKDRTRARFKYTIDDKGIPWFKEQLETRLGQKIEPVRPFEFTSNADSYGWQEDEDGRFHFTLFVENGRIANHSEAQFLNALREIALVHDGEFRVTPNQNLIIANISARNKPHIQAMLEAFELDKAVENSLLRRNAMACVAFPTCGLAMAESERYLPHFITKVEKLLSDNGLEDTPITLRMTGCPNGCARPYVAEIAFTGRAPGKYNMYLGGGFWGQRLNRMYLENVDEKRILEELGKIIPHYASEREHGEYLGDFVVRKNYVRAVESGQDFNLD